MLKQELINYVSSLRQMADKAELTIESFSYAKFDWDNITQTQLDIIRELLPFSLFKPSQELLNSIKDEVTK